MKRLILLLLLVASISAQVPTPEVALTGRIGPKGNFPLLNSGTISMPSDANYTMAYPDMSASVLRITSTVPLTTTRNVIAPLTTGFEFTVQNSTLGGHDIVIKGATGAGVTIPTGESRLVVSDGTNYVNAAGTSAGGGGAAPGAGEVIFTGVSDAVKDTTCSTTNGSPNLTCSDAPFSTCPTDKWVSVTGGIQSPDDEPNSLITTILSCNSATVAVMGKNATGTRARTVARWGTDNGPALYALANAPSTAGKIFKITPGNYLVQAKTLVGGWWRPDAFDGAIQVYSNTSYIIQTGVHIYWIGPSGGSGFAPHCATNQWMVAQGAGNTGICDNEFGLWNFHDPDSFQPNGTHNVHIQVDGIIEGDNTDGGADVPFINSSHLAYGNGIATDGSTITDITFDGVGALLNLYGFSYHFSGAIRRATFRGISHERVGKGLNPNGFQIDASFNRFTHSGGIEIAGADVSIVGNHFDDTTSISVGGYGAGMFVCNGYNVSANVFTNMAHTNINISQCPVGAVISANSFYIPAFPVYATAINLHDDSGSGDLTPTHDNLIVGNTFYAPPVGCQGAVFTYGGVTGGNVFASNHMTGPCQYGYIFNGTMAGKTDLVKNDTLYANSWGISVATSTGGVPLFIQGAYLPYNGIEDPYSTVQPGSWWHNWSGLMQCPDPNKQPCGGSGGGGGFTAGGDLGGTGTHQQVIGIRNKGVPTPLAAGYLHWTGTSFKWETPGSETPGGGGATEEVGFHEVGSAQTGMSADINILAGFVAPGPGYELKNCKLHATAISGKAYCALYAADGTGGSPGTLLCDDTTGTTLTGAGWNVITSTNLSTCPVLTSGAKYFLSVVFDDYVMGSYEPNIADAGGTHDRMAFYTYGAGLGCCQFLSTLDGVAIKGPNMWSVSAEITAPSGGDGGGPGPGPGGSTALSSLTPATADHTLANHSFAQTWQWTLTGVNPIAGLAVAEPVGAPSTNSGANSALLSVFTRGASTVWPFRVSAHDAVRGFGVDPYGHIRTLGDAKFIGPVELPGSLANLTSLGTDASGNIVPGASGSGGFSAGGDLGGTGTSQQVIGLHSHPVPNVTAAGYLHWNGSAFSWASVSSGAVSALGGDLGGTATSQQVIGVRSHAIPIMSTAGYLHWNGSVFTWDIPGGGFSAGGDLGGSATSQQVTGIRSHPVPAVSSGYLHFNGSAFVWDTPSAGDGGAGPASVGTLTGAAQDNAIHNDSFAQHWQWKLTGSSPKNGFAIEEALGDPSTISAPDSALLAVTTTDNSTAWSFRASGFHGTRGVGVEPNGYLLAFGGSKYIGDVLLPNVKGAVVLGTDASGNIVPGSDAGAFIAGGDIYGTNTAQIVIGIHDSRIPALPNTAAYLHWTGSEWAWETPTAGSAAMHTFQGATSNHQLMNNSFWQSWEWRLTGTNSTAGLSISEPDNSPSTNTGTDSALVSIFTRHDSTVWPFRASGNDGQRGAGVDSLGYLRTFGGSKLVGAVQLPDLPNEDALATDPVGNIIAGSSSRALRASPASHPAGSIACFKEDGKSLGSCQTAMTGTPPTCDCR